jgi:predicted 3-demethylubiquinone-9 3-methyltransferase (glyoxalase superfamily)
VSTQKIATFLMFDGRAEEAINFYTSLFADSTIVKVDHSGASSPEQPGAVAQAAFTLKGTVFYGNRQSG